MKKVLLLILAGVFVLTMVCSDAWAQATAEEEFTLEEITVTAEKRAVSLQELPASVVALEGGDLAQQGKITTAQILEGVPNLTYRGGGGTNPNGNISIRGIQRIQESGGTNDILPATTATYVDGVYQGIGGNYDTSRVEVLRGPQGTLYGRSATGGVVAFYTNDPKLDEFDINASVEIGTASLKNVQAAINVPAGDMFAFRAAAHYIDREGYFEAEGGQSTTKEGRIKALFQPNDALGIVLTLAMQETVNWGGGWNALLTAPDEIDYEGSYTEPREGAPQKYRQASINLNYDFGGSTLTWIGGYHDYDYTGLGAEAVKEGKGHADQNIWPTDDFHSEEIRLASDTEGQITWLVGANYFNHEFDTSLLSVQTSWPDDPELTASSGYLVPIWQRQTKGTFDNYGLFTEETFKMQENFRITAGLRYDKTKLNQSMLYQMNENLTAMGNNLNPPIWTDPPATFDHDDTYNNVTYKLRFEYDVTQDNMLYFLTATGFMPGYSALSPDFQMGPTGPYLAGWLILQFDQQELTSYEFGTKNTFLGNTLRLNADLFYYDYEGYPEGYNLRIGGGPPIFTVMPVPLRVLGLEVDMEYLITMYDKISLTAGYQDIKITDYPSAITWSDGSVTDGSYAAMLDQLPGHPKTKATIGYDHTFTLGDGSILAPRAELVYTGGHYLSQMTYLMTDLGEKPYNHQSAYMLANIGATWTSADQKYSATAYVRNALDEEYKAGVSLVSNPPLSAIGVTPGDPRTFGAMFSIKF